MDIPCPKCGKNLETVEHLRACGLDLIEKTEEKLLRNSEGVARSLCKSLAWNVPYGHDQLFGLWRRCHSIELVMDAIDRSARLGLSPYEALTQLLEEIR